MRGQQAVYVIAAMILIGISVLSLIGFVTSTVGHLGQDSLENLCRSSIETRIMTGINSGEGSTFQFTGLSCKKQDLKVTPNILYQDNLFSTLVYEDEERVENARLSVMKKMADQMAKCKYMFLDNKHEDVLSGSGSEFWEIFGFDEDDPKCFLCYSAAVKELGEDISAEEFNEYIFQTKYRGNITYADYFHGGGELGGKGAYLLGSGISDDGLYGIAYFGRNSANGLPVNFAEMAETALDFGVAGVAVGVVVCVAGGCHSLAVIAGVLSVGFVGGSVIGLEYSERVQLKQDVLYDEENGYLKTREYGYFVYDELDVLDSFGCKTR